MKTLDEVISEMSMMNKEDRCMYCPFDWEKDGSLKCERGTCVYDDALHYLKEYRMQVDDIVAKRKALEYKSKRYDEMCETIQKQGQEHEDLELQGR